jgi:tetratricopeptide (TPR) repeat protein
MPPAEAGLKNGGGLRDPRLKPGAKFLRRLRTATPNALLSVAKLLLSKGLYAQATPFLRDAVRQLPESAEAHYSLALAFFKAREYEEMWSHVEKAQSLDPKGVRNWLLHAMGLIDIGNFAKAKESLQRVQLLQPENQSSRFLMSRVLLEEGAYAAVVDPKDPAPLPKSQLRQSTLGGTTDPRPTTLMLHRLLTGLLFDFNRSVHPQIRQTKLPKSWN